MRATPVGPIGSSHDNDMGSGFETIHESQQLGDNSPFYFSLHIMQASDMFSMYF